VVTFRFGDALSQKTSAGHKNFTLKFLAKGKIGAQAPGLYLNNYEEAGETKKLLVTDLEPSSARTVFACFDEPQFKATFRVQISTTFGYISLSNMPVDDVINDPERTSNQLYRFQTTPKMSTYLLCVVMCQLVYKEDFAGKIPVRVYAPPTLISQAE